MKTQPYVCFFIISLLLLYSTLSAQETDFEFQSFPEFMSASGTSFKGNFKFIGANLDPWRFMTGVGEVYSYNQIRAIVRDAVQHTGAKVIRVHLNGGGFEPAVGSYNEAAFKQLDYVIAACREYKVYVLIALRDYLWSPWPPQAYDPYWYLGGGSKANPNKDAILLNAQAKQAFKNFMAYILGRRNTITGTYYKNETNILGWELINEPNVMPNGSIRTWINEMAGFVRTIDANHLIGIAIGAMEYDWWAPGTMNWKELDTPALDFVDIHYYADPNLYSHPVNQHNVQKIKQRVASVRALHKVAIIGEFGCISTVDRETILNLYTTVMDAAFGEGAAGAMPYSWGPKGPNGWGGPGSFAMYSDDTRICTLLKNYVIP
jgi:mannan endo-1,4-beta-mannosidase